MLLKILDRDKAMEGSTRLRQEWQVAAEGKPLAEVQGNVGLMLTDVGNAIGFLPEEASQVLGIEKCIELEQILN